MTGQGIGMKAGGCWKWLTARGYVILWPRRPEIYELSARLSEEAQKIASDFKTGLGQETYYHEGLVENLKQGQALTLAGTRYVLVEFDPQEAYHSLYQAVR